MTLSDMAYAYGIYIHKINKDYPYGTYMQLINQEDDPAIANRILQCCPWLKYDIRAEVAEAFGIDDLAQISKDKIIHYILHGKDYDVIEISRIVTEFK